MSPCAVWSSRIVTPGSAGRKAPWTIRPARRPHFPGGIGTNRLRPEEIHPGAVVGLDVVVDELVVEVVACGIVLVVVLVVLVVVDRGIVLVVVTRGANVVVVDGHVGGGRS